jgi:hypothetical protein
MVPEECGKYSSTTFTTDFDVCNMGKGTGNSLVLFPDGTAISSF